MGYHILHRRAGPGLPETPQPVPSNPLISADLFRPGLAAEREPRPTVSTSGHVRWLGLAAHPLGVSGSGSRNRVSAVPASLSFGKLPNLDPGDRQRPQLAMDDF